MKAFFLFLFSLTAFSQVSITDGEAYFVSGSDKFRLNLSTLTEAQSKRIFGNYNPKREIGNFLRSRPMGDKANLKPNMSDVQNQGQRGTCSHFATVTLVEHLYDKNSNLSEQCLAWLAGNTDSGNIPNGLNYVQKKGVYLERDCPYKDPADYAEWDSASAEKMRELEGKARLDLPKNFSNIKEVFPWFEIYSENVDKFSARELIEHIQRKIAAGYPVGAAVYFIGDAGWGEGWIDKIPSEAEIKKSCDHNRKANSPMKQCSSHALVFTGYDNSKKVFYFKNSWRKTWGLTDSLERSDPSDRKGVGYGAMSYDHFAKFRLDSITYISR